MTAIFDVALVGAAREVASIAAIEALACGSRDGAPLVLGWPAYRAGAAVVPASGAARRLSRALAARELDSVARGRIAYCSLGADEPLTVARRAAAVARGAVILAIHGARDRAIDELLEHSGVVVLCGALAPGVTELARIELGGRGLDVRVQPTPVGPLAAALARGGVIASPSAVPAGA